WTDQKIRVHAFYCVLALRLCLILRKMLYENGIFLSVNKMLSLLEKIKQVVTIYPKKGESKKDLEVYSQTKLTPKLKKMASIFDILKYIKVG
ncbi:MAG: transposase, partial [Peptococcaceae bacterium]|nr:transposase [Peptococcaceae bacterium]